MKYQPHLKENFVSISQTDRRTPVLIIEDNPNHAKSIEDVLPRDRYVCKHHSAVDSEQIYGYLAQHPDSQILIVDLQLDVASAADPYEEGTHLIRDRLWTYNRTAFFVVFSEFIPDKQVREFNKLEPHWSFVQKVSVEGGVKLTADVQLSGASNRVGQKTLSQSCLEKLKVMVDACRESAPPPLIPERLDSFVITQRIQNFSVSRPAHTQIYSAAIDRIRESVNVLNMLSAAAEPYVKAGRPSLQLAIGVYGSCGRLEKRPKNSDIEFAVFIEGNRDDVGQPLRELAVMFWNRMMFFVETQGWEYEGQAIVNTRNPKILGSDAADEAFVLLDKYMPIISAHALVNVDFSKSQSHVRNRHLQILTELRPVFNSELIFRMKKDLIVKNAGQICAVSQLLSAQYIGDLITQAYIDMKPKKLEGFKNKKRYIYRMVGLAALQLGLIGYALGNDDKLEHDSQWEDLFTFLVLPSLGKILLFEDYWSKSYGNDEAGTDILKQVKNLADCYCSALADLENLPDETDETTEITATESYRRIFDMITEQFLDIGQKLKEHDSCYVLMGKSVWLFEFKRYQNLMNGL